MTLPTVSDTLGPEWASEVNECLTTIDSHDHSDGKGTLITPAGMEINDSLDFQDNDIENAKSVGLFAQDAAITALLGTLQRVGGNLWFINGAGAGVQITSGSSVISTGSGVLTPSTPAAYPYTILPSDAQSVLIVDSTAAARSLNMPAASNAMFFMVKDDGGVSSTKNITISPDGSDTIEGVNLPYVINSDRACVGFLSDGLSKWYVI